MKFFLLIIFIIFISDIENKLTNFCIGGENKCYKENKEKKNKKKKEQYEEEILKYQNPSTFNFLYNALYNRFKSSTSIYNKYLNGFTHLLNTMYKIYYEYIHKDDLKVEDFRNLIEENNDFDDEKTYFNEYEKNEENENFKFRDLSNYPYNNTDLYETQECLTTPDIKAESFLFYCNDSRVSFNEYERLSNSSSQKCEFYTNTIKVCFCPVNYYNCNKNPVKQLFCKINNLTANNNEYDLLKQRDSFYHEYSNRIIIPLSKKKYKFKINLLCGNPKTEGKLKDNFYFSSDIDPLSYIKLLSIENKEKLKNQSITIEDLKDKKLEILDYYYKDKNFVLYDNVSLALNFSIYDMQWLIPYKNTNINITEEDGKKLLSGETFTFEIDFDKMEIKNDLIEIFTNKKYNAFHEGDLYYYEIKIYDKNDNILFFDFQGEIDKNK